METWLFRVLAWGQALSPELSMEISSSPHTSLWGRFGYNPHFMDGTTEAQRA